MVQNYTADLKHALWSLQSTGSLPPFPKPKWKNVLSRMAVNLDTIFSGLFSTLADNKITTSIGDFDLSVSKVGCRQKCPTSCAQVLHCMISSHLPYCDIVRNFSDEIKLSVCRIQEICNIYLFSFCL
jgi:hypothetical protein